MKVERDDWDSEPSTDEEPVVLQIKKEEDSIDRPGTIKVEASDEDREPDTEDEPEPDTEDDVKVESGHSADLEPNEDREPDTEDEMDVLTDEETMESISMKGVVVGSGDETMELVDEVGRSSLLRDLSLTPARS